MSKADQDRWDERYEARDQTDAQPALPDRFQPFVELIAAAADALEIACGAGETSVWLAGRGIRVRGYDISAIAIDQATELATRYGVADSCTFAVADFHDGLPSGSAVDLVVCNMFRAPDLDQALVDRLRPGGLLAIAALSEVGAGPGPFRAKPRELVRAFAELDSLGSAEDDGVAWLVGRKASSD